MLCRVILSYVIIILFYPILTNSINVAEKAILFMTDGPPQETNKKVLDTLGDQIDETPDEVLILTYGIVNDSKYLCFQII